MPVVELNKHKIFYREEGEGPLLLMWPGNTAFYVCHQNDMTYFSTRFHVASPDVRGTRESDRIQTFHADWWEQGFHDAAAVVKHPGYQKCIQQSASR